MRLNHPDAHWPVTVEVRTDQGDENRYQKYLAAHH